MAKADRNHVEVSVVVPCYNEEKTIPQLLDAIYRQTYPIRQLEVIIADAQSKDQTRDKVKEFINQHVDLRVHVIDNFERTIPAAVNKAIEYARGIYIVRLDAHSVPNRDYIAHCVGLLKENKADNVGGVWEIMPGNDSCIAQAIARAAAHPIGAGDARYRISNSAGYVDTVPFGAFKKETFEKVGGFNQNMLANEDYEFNTRLRMRNGKIWLDPRIRSVYYARSTLKELAKQYWRYGYWKYQMLRKFPKSIRWRQALPPLFVFGIFLFLLLSFIFPFARIILGLTLTFYISILIFGSVIEVLRLKKLCFLNMFFVFMCMHLSWGSGFLFSMIKGPKS